MGLKDAHGVVALPWSLDLFENTDRVLSCSQRHKRTFSRHNQNQPQISLQKRLHRRMSNSSSTDKLSSTSVDSGGTPLTDIVYMMLKPVTHSTPWWASGGNSMNSSAVPAGTPRGGWGTGRSGSWEVSLWRMYELGWWSRHQRSQLSTISFYFPQWNCYLSLSWEKCFYCQWCHQQFNGWSSRTVQIMWHPKGKTAFQHLKFKFTVAFFSMGLAAVGHVGQTQTLCNHLLTISLLLCDPLHIVIL